jgi:hypothetical protein
MQCQKLWPRQFGTEDLCRQEKPSLGRKVLRARPPLWRSDFGSKEIPVALVKKLVRASMKVMKGKPR